MRFLHLQAARRPSGRRAARSGHEDPGRSWARHAFALHPDPVEGLLHRVYVVFQESDGRVWAAGTDMMAPNRDSGELFVDRLNETPGIDRAEWSALPARAFAAGSEPAPGDRP